MFTDYSKLSKEELIQKLLRSEHQIAAMQSAHDTIASQLTITQKKLAKTEDKLDNSIAEQKSLIYIANKFIQNAHCTLLQINNSLFLYPEDALTQDFLATFQSLFNDCLKVANLYKAAFFCSPFSKKGSDVNSTICGSAPDSASDDELAKLKVEAKNLEEQVKNLNGSLKNNNKYFREIKDAIFNAFERSKELNQADLTQRLQKLIDTFNIKPKHSNKGNKEAKRRKGRKATKIFDNKTKKTSKAKLNKDQCSCAHSDLCEIAVLTEKMVSQCRKMDDIVKALPKDYKVYICNHCGKCHIAYDPLNDDFPVTHNRRTGMSLIRAVCEGLYKGIPLDRFISPISSRFNLGHETVPQNLRDYIKLYIDPVYQMICNQAKELEVLLADETVYDCLHSQGKGNMSKATKESIDKRKIRDKNYILALSSTPYSSTPLALFSNIAHRSFDSIEQVITPDFKFKYLVTDAYSPYGRICKQVEGRQWQTCLIHLRREIVRASNPKAYFKDLSEVSEDILCDKVMKDFSATEGDEAAASVLLSVFFTISKIYELEGALLRDNSKDKALFEKQKLANREQIRELLDQIDKLIDSVKDEYAEQTSTGRYKKKESSPYAGPIVYYLNSREHFKTFLQNAAVPPDSNTVEGIIRKFTLIRSAMKHKVNPDDLQDLCKIMTVYKTLELNGIDPEQYLCRLNNDMFAHAFAKKITQYFRDEGSPEDRAIVDIKIKDCSVEEMKELLSDFAMSKYPIFNTK